jgi:hypothetical protein
MDMEVRDGPAGNGDGDGVAGSFNASALAKGPKGCGRKATAQKTTGGQPPPVTGSNKRKHPDNHAESNPATPLPAK